MMEVDGYLRLRNYMVSMCVPKSKEDEIKLWWAKKNSFSYTCVLVDLWSKIKTGFDREDIGSKLTLFYLPFTVISIQLYDLKCMTFKSLVACK